MRLVIWMLRLYPRAWRERYETEMVALLEQHEITLWTVLDLLVGAVDARLDPHYRLSRPLIPLRRLQNSWRLMGSACAAFLLMLIMWNLHDIPLLLDLSCNYGSVSEDSACMTRQGVQAHAPALASTILNNTSLLAFFSFLFIVFAFVVWTLWQTRKTRWNLLRLLPIVVLVLLLFKPHLFSEWQQNVLLVVFMVTLVQGAGAMLTCARRWEKRHSLAIAVPVRLLALLVIVGMLLVCIADGGWLVGIWQLMPRLNLIYPYIQTELIIEFAVMVLATLLALFALVRSTFALRALYAATPK